ncbi:MAG: T9SS type A sorting domain-containing protein [Calditrichia bacterium]|nr:T9SS type A sorting domain-containing protein [Calditrichia bacterium]
MRLLTTVLLLISIIGLSFAQNSPDPLPLYGKTDLSEPFIEGKNPSTRNLQLHPEYDVLIYDINTTIFPDSQKIEAMTSIRFVVTINMENNLLFDFAGLQLDSVFLDSDIIQSTLQGELLLIHLETPLMTGDTHLVRIHYQGTPEKGLYFRSNSNGDPVIYSHNEPYDAHFWFPCKDDPSDKAQLVMAGDVPDQFIVLSNGELIDTTKSSPQNTKYLWQEDYPIATYLISFAASSYIVTTNTFTWDGSDLLLEYYVYPTDVSRGAKALEWVEEMLEFYSFFIGEYPFFSDKYAMSEVPFREAAAMENQTSTTMGDFVMDNEDIIAHELVHQWWGDALTPQSFLDIWLNEGFATYFDALFTEFKYGEEAFLQRMDDFRTYMRSDGSLAYPIYNPPQEYLFGNAVYMKGAWVLHMLRNEVGDQIFKEIIQKYYEEYNYLNVQTRLFVETVESVSGQSYATFFDQWLNYGGIPLLIGSWEQGKNIVQLSVRQDQPEPVYQFDLEVLIKGISADTLVVIPVFERESQRSISFGEPVSKIIIDPNEKILSTNNSPVYYIPSQSSLIRLYPNPFNESITITYQIEKVKKVEIIIYDVLGQRVETLLNEKKTTGIHQVDWDGRAYASGIYYCVMNTSGTSDVRKMTLIK